MTPRIILATSTNEGYYPRTRPFLDSIQKHAEEIERYCLCLDFLPEEGRCPKAWDEIKFDNIPKTWFQPVDTSRLKLPPNNFCLQHGEFLDWIPDRHRVPNLTSDVILFTDADLRMQRPFSVNELWWLKTMQRGEVFVGYNAGPEDTLLDEAYRLWPKVDMLDLADWWDLEAPCFNWGCVAATRATWEAICKIYVENFPTVDEQLTHVAKQQWLLSSITSSYFTHVEMPTSFHCHRHYGIPEGCEFRDGLVYSNGELALFAHKFDR